MIQFEKQFCLCLQTLQNRITIIINIIIIIIINIIIIIHLIIIIIDIIVSSGLQ